MQNTGRGIRLEKGWGKIIPSSLHRLYLRDIFVGRLSGNIQQETCFYDPGILEQKLL